LAYTYKTIETIIQKNTKEKKIIKNDNSPITRELSRNDLVICVWYYAHRMNNFRKHLKNSSIMFGEVQDYFFVIKFQSRGLAYDHGLLWVKNAPQYNISPNE
jgi:hypothetical protein